MSSKPKKNSIRIYAHRGASGYYVENTLEAFHQAIRLGADALELDVFVTRDGVPFVYHDRKCRIRGKEGLVKTSTLKTEDIEKIILPGDHHVPTFKEFLDEFARTKNRYGDPLMISIDAQNYGAEKAIARFARAYDCEEQIEICHKYGFAFRNIRKVSKKIKITASNSIRPFTLKTANLSLSKYRKYNVQTFNIKADDFKPFYLSTLKKMGYNIYIWDLHSEEKLRKFMSFFPDGIFSNYPDLAVKIRDEILNNTATL